MTDSVGEQRVYKSEVTSQCKGAHRIPAPPGYPRISCASLNHLRPAMRMHLVRSRKKVQNEELPYRPRYSLFRRRCQNSTASMRHFLTTPHYSSCPYAITVALSFPSTGSTNIHIFNQQGLEATADKVEL